MPAISGKRRIKNHFVAALGEFVGTFLFLFLAFAGTQTANEPSSANASGSGPQLQALSYISLVFGFSLAVNVWLFFRISGGLFNPVVRCTRKISRIRSAYFVQVTVALWLIGANPAIRSIFIFIAQMAAGIAAAAVARTILPGNNVMYGVALAPGMNTSQRL